MKKRSKCCKELAFFLTLFEILGKIRYLWKLWGVAAWSGPTYGRLWHRCHALGSLGQHWDQGLESKKKGQSVEKKWFIFQLSLRFLSSSGTCGSSGEWQPDQARPMDEFGTVVTLWITWPSVGIMPGWKEIRVKVLHNIRFLFQL